MTIKDKTTGAGGNRGYRMTRSKYKIGKDGYGAVVTVARENLLKANHGKDPGPNIVAMHIRPGAHHGKDQKAVWGSRSKNTAESNMQRDGGLSTSDKLKLKNYSRTTQKNDKKTLAEKLKKGHK